MTMFIKIFVKSIYLILMYLTDIPNEHYGPHTCSLGWPDWRWETDH